MWYTVQLIADCISYAWLAIEKQYPEPSSDAERGSRPIESLPPPRFRYGTGENSKLDACEAGWRTSLAPSEGFGAATTFAPVQIGDGWRFFSQRAGKEGWQFDANLSSHSVRAGPLRFFPPITFRMTFGGEGGERPRLVVSYLRSYENFGRAAIWIDGQEAQTQLLHTMHHCYTYVCEARYGTGKRRANALAIQNSRSPTLPRLCTANESGLYSIPWKRPLELARSPHCELILSHSSKELSAPLGLDGRWDSPSSQIVASAFDTGWSKLSDRNLIGTRFPIADQTANLTTPGVHNVSIALVQEIADAHPPPLFKLTSLYSC